MARLEVRAHPLHRERIHVWPYHREVVISRLEARGGPVKHFGRDGEKSFPGKALRHVADMGIDAEGFLEDQDARMAARAGRTGDVESHGGPIIDGDIAVFAKRGAIHTASG